MCLHLQLKFLRQLVLHSHGSFYIDGIFQIIRHNSCNKNMSYPTKILLVLQLAIVGHVFLDTLDSVVYICSEIQFRENQIQIFLNQLFDEYQGT